MNSSLIISRACAELCGLGKRLSCLTVVTVTMLLSLAVQAAAEPVSFRQEIARVLLDHCLACHGEKKAEGGYRIDTFERLAGDQSDSGSTGLVARQRAESEVLRRIASDDADERMPLGGDPLPMEFVELLGRWIDEGAAFDGPDPQALLASYAPLLHPDPPELYRQPVPIAAMHFSGDGSELYVGGYFEITVWDTADGKLLRRMPGASQRTTAIDMSEDGQRLAVGGGMPGKRGTVRLFDLKAGQLDAVFQPVGDMVLDLALSPDGSRLAAGTAESRLLVYSLQSREAPLTIAGHSDWVTAVAWSPDGKRLGSGSRDRTAKVFDVESGELQLTYSSHGQTVRGLAFHPNGTEVYSAGTDRQVHRWKLDSGEKLTDIDFVSQVNRLPIFGATLFAAAADGTVRQYDTTTEAETRQYTGHRDWALSVAYHEGAKRVAAGAFDGEVKIWNSDDGSLVCQFVAAPGYVRESAP